MLLVIDIGNTNIVLGVFEGDRLAHSWRVATRREQTADEYAFLCRGLFNAAGLPAEPFDAIVISSVVPPLNEPFLQLSRRYFGIQPLFVQPEQQKIIPVRYTPVSDVGADRIVTALAAIEMASGPAIVVDFGTATTFDAVSAQGEYFGGVIAPGVGISSEALFQRASRLPKVEIRKPIRVIGDSTIGSMQSGLFYGYVALVEGILQRMQEELGKATVIATGGYAALFSPEVPAIDRVEENLMLLGLKIYLERSR